MNTNTVNATERRLRPDSSIVLLRARLWGRVRRVGPEELRVLMDARWAPDVVSGHVLIARHALLDQVEGLVRSWRQRLLAGSCLYLADVGIWTCTDAGWQRLTARLPRALEEIAAVVRALASEWEDVLTTARRPLSEGGLGPLFREEWYPTADQLPMAYGLSAHRVALVPSDDATAAVIAGSAVRAARTMVIDAVTRAVDRLRTAQRLRPTVLDAVMRVAESVSDLAVAPDDALADAATRVAELLRTAPAEAIADRPMERQLLADQLQAIVSTLVEPERCFD